MVLSVGQDGCGRNSKLLTHIRRIRMANWMSAGECGWIVGRVQKVLYWTRKVGAWTSSKSQFTCARKCWIRKSTVLRGGKSWSISLWDV